MSRSTGDRTVSAWKAGKFVFVRVGNRTETTATTISEALETLSRMARQPAPLIWRALGVDA